MTGIIGPRGPHQPTASATSLAKSTLPQPKTEVALNALKATRLLRAEIQEIDETTDYQPLTGTEHIIPMDDTGIRNFVAWVSTTYWACMVFVEVL